MIQEFKDYFDAQGNAAIGADAINIFQNQIAQLNDEEREEALFHVLNYDYEDFIDKPASVECVKLLMQMGVSANATGDFGSTPLGRAVVFGYAECARLLIEHGASPSEVNPEGMSVLENAVLCGKINCVKLLLEKGADLNHSGPSGGVLDVLHRSQPGNEVLESILNDAFNQYHGDLAGETDQPMGDM